MSTEETAKKVLTLLLIVKNARVGFLLFLIPIKTGLCISHASNGND